jgi:MinD-like ATPase involved in chromosome partitioning or flagellar assembly
VTSVALCSVAGSPGVTTLTCALGAVWPASQRVIVAEVDPNGGALAARFGLQANRGVTSFVVARPQVAGTVAVDEHVQQLPGGLDVLVGPAGTEPARVVDAEVEALCSLLELPSDVLFDCGRLVLEAAGQRRLVTGADVVVVVTAAEPAAAAGLAVAASRLRTLVAGRLGVVVVGGAKELAADVAAAAGLELAGRVPVDQRTAAIVRGEPGSARRLARAPLLRAAVRLTRWVTAAPPSTPRSAPARPDSTTPARLPAEPVDGRKVSAMGPPARQGVAERGR